MLLQRQPVLRLPDVQDVPGVGCCCLVLLLTFDIFDGQALLFAEVDMQLDLFL